MHIHVIINTPFYVSPEIIWRYFVRSKILTFYGCAVALEMTWVALQRTGGALERTGGAKDRTGVALQRSGFALQRSGGALDRTGVVL